MNTKKGVRFLNPVLCSPWKSRAPKLYLITEHIDDHENFEKTYADSPLIKNAEAVVPSEMSRTSTEVIYDMSQKQTIANPTNSSSTCAPHEHVASQNKPNFSASFYAREKNFARNKLCAPGNCPVSGYVQSNTPITSPIGPYIFFKTPDVPKGTSQRCINHEWNSREKVIADGWTSSFSSASNIIVRDPSIQSSEDDVTFRENLYQTQTISPLNNQQVFVRKSSGNADRKLTNINTETQGPMQEEQTNSTVAMEFFQELRNVKSTAGIERDVIKIEEESRKRKLLVVQKNLVGPTNYANKSSGNDLETGYSSPIVDAKKLLHCSHGKFDINESGDIEFPNEKTDSQDILGSLGNSNDAAEKKSKVGVVLKKKKKGYRSTLL